MEHNRPVGSRLSSDNNLFSMTMKNSGVISHQTYDIEPALYDCCEIGRPMTMKTQLGFMTTKAFSYHSTLTDNTSGTLLATNNRMLMLIDRQTRKPCLIPEPLYQQFAPHATMDRMRVTNVPDIPARHHRWATRANHSDSDIIYHVNQSVFGRFCMDCAVDAASHGFYKELVGDFYQYNVVDVQITYKREVFPGDDISVITWQHKDNPYLLYFVIENVSLDAVAFQCVMKIQH